MATAEQLVTVKGGDLVQLPLDATVVRAAQTMVDRNVGCVLVTDAGRLVGIFTERDVLRRIVAEGRDPSSTRLGEAMTSPVACAAPHTLLDELRIAMRERWFRHIPVVDGDRVLGVISMGDLNRAEQRVGECTITYLDQFVGAT